MSDHPVSSDDSQLADVWRGAARRASDAQLVACVVVAIAVAIACLVMILVDVHRTLRWWPLILPGLLAGTFGVWGITDRELSARDRDDGSAHLSRRVLAALKVGSVVAAGVVAALEAIGILRLTIGTWTL